MCEGTGMYTLFSACYWTIALTEDQVCTVYLPIAMKGCQVMDISAGTS